MENKEIYADSYFSNLESIYKKQTFFVKNRIRNVFELIGPLHGIKILDLGTANGLVSIECAKQGALSIGLDFSKVALKNAKRSANQSSVDVEFVCSDCGILPFKSESFDMLVLADLVEHLDKSLYEKTIMECYHVLKKGGRIMIYTPNKEHFIDQLRKRNIILPTFRGHTNLMNMEEVITILKKNNFLIEKAYYRPSHIPIFNLFESFMIYLPIFNKFFGRRICILSKK
jgi:2-polyprenyl-3-methyl-5-hydroxy-6-metoxy-1,4-benzoquinol methylase